MVKGQHFASGRRNVNERSIATSRSNLELEFPAVPNAHAAFRRGTGNVYNESVRYACRIGIGQGAVGISWQGLIGSRRVGSHLRVGCFDPESNQGPMGLAF